MNTRKMFYAAAAQLTLFAALLTLTLFVFFEAGPALAQVPPTYSQSYVSQNCHTGIGSHQVVNLSGTDASAICQQLAAGFTQNSCPTTFTEVVLQTVGGVAAPVCLMMSNGNPNVNNLNLSCPSGYVLQNLSCVKNADRGTGSQQCVGDPILVGQASLLERQSDYETAGPQPLSVVRSYNSASGPGYYLGDAFWHFSFEYALSLGSSSASLTTPEGLVFQFTLQSGKWAVANNEGPVYLSQPSSGITTATLPNGTVVNFALGFSGLRYKVVSIKRNDGLILNLNYDASNQYGDIVTSIVDSYGRKLKFSYLSASSRVVSDIVYNDGTNDSFRTSFTYMNPSLSGYTSYVILSSVSRYTNAVQGGGVSWQSLDSYGYSYENNVSPFLVTGFTDARGIKVSTWTYDASGRPSSNVRPSNLAQYSVSYNDSNISRSVTNPLGKQQSFNYSSIKGVLLLNSTSSAATTSTPASSTSMSYDAYGNISAKTDEEGRQTSYVNDAYGRPTSITRGVGSSSSSTSAVTWDSVLRLPSQTVEQGVTTSYTWNAQGQILSQSAVDTTSQSVPYSTNGQTRTITYGYDTNGRLTSSSGPLSGVSIGYSYSSAGYLSSVTNELGKVTTVTSVNSRGQPTSITDPNGVITSLTYDGHGWLTGVSVDTANSPATTTIGYNAVGDVTSITNPIGGTQTFTYDNARRLMTVSNSAGEVASYTRDVMGNATSITLKDATPSTTYAKTRTFDELGRLIKEVGANASNSTYTFGYDRTDNLISIKDPRSNIFSNGFDALNRLISQTDEGNATVNLTRNGTDAITAYKDPRGLTSTYVRNGFGEIIQEVSPDKGSTTYVRDVRGLVTQRTDPRGLVTNYAYDNAGRLTGISYPSTTAYSASLTWDASGGGNYGIGRLSGLSDESGVDWRVFNTKGYIQAYYRTPSSLQSSLTSYYTYDAAGNVVGVNYPSGRYIGYQRDNLGRITNIVTYQTPTSQTGQTIASSITYNPFGGVKSLVQGTGLTETFTTDTDNRITAVQVLYPNGTTYAVNLALTWMGDTLTSSTDNQNSNTSQTFTYTATRRLATAVGYYGSYAWTYDQVGNRTSEKLGTVLSTYAYPTTSNRLSSVTPGTSAARTFTYDLAGNITADSRSGSLGLTYQYDVLGRLSKAFQTNAPANGGSYTYDTRGRLSARTVTQSTAPTTTTTFYVYDLSDRLIAEVNASGQTLKEYIWLDDIPVAVVDGVNTSMPAIYTVHVDHLKRPIRMIAANGTWAWDVDYAPFGGTAYLYTNPEVMNGRFPGQWFQLETGLAYNWHRHYDPTLGRYIQPDPLVVDEDDAAIAGISQGTLPGGGNTGNAPAFAAGWKNDADFMTGYNLVRPMFQDGSSVFGYAGQSPMTKVDPTGLMGSKGADTGGADNFCRPDPGNCSDEQRNDLQERVENACGAAQACKGTDSIATIQAKIRGHYECIRARSLINLLCYGGGDSGHKNSIFQRFQAISACWKLGGGVPK